MSTHLAICAVGALAGLAAISSRGGSQSKLFTRMAAIPLAPPVLSGPTPGAPGVHEVYDGLYLVDQGLQDGQPPTGMLDLSLGSQYRKLISRVDGRRHPVMSGAAFSSLPKEIQEALAIWSRAHSMNGAESRWARERAAVNGRPGAMIHGLHNFRDHLNSAIGVGGNTVIRAHMMDEGTITIEVSVNSAPSRVSFGSRGGPSGVVEIKGSRLVEKALKVLGMDLP